MTSIKTQGYAGADLSSTGRYLFVYQDGADNEKWKVLTDPFYVGSVGILDNAPADDGRALVTLSGYQLAKLGVALEPGDFITNNASGQVVKYTGQGVVRGVFCPEYDGATAATLSDGASGNEERILLLPPAGPAVIKTTTTRNFTTISHGSFQAAGAITVTGVAVSDTVEVGCDSLTAGMFPWAKVSAANTITLYLFNMSGTTVDHASDVFYLTITTE